MRKVLIISLLLLISVILILGASDNSFIHFKNDDSYLLGDKCRTKPDNQSGICVNIKNCSFLKTRHESILNLCSYDKLEPIICCGLRSEKIIVSKRISETKCEEYKEIIKPVEPKEFHITVVGGLTTKPSEFPHMAAIGWKLSNTIQWKCGGSLISEKFILTAAHCTKNEGIEPSVVRISDQNLVTMDDGAFPEEFEIIRIIKHPLYKPPAVYNDIALIELNSTVIFKELLRPACLWQNHAINYTKVIATGWGRLEYDKETSDELQKVELGIVGNEICTTFFDVSSRTREGIINSQVCVGNSEGGKDTCQGDSGGPIQVHHIEFNKKVYHIIGVTSFGKICGSSAPSVYTRVSSFLDWIESIVWPNNF